MQRHLKVLEGVLDAFSKIDTGEIITSSAEKPLWHVGHLNLGLVLLCCLL